MFLHRLFTPRADLAYHDGIIMMFGTIVAAIAPVFLLLLLGMFLRWRDFPGGDFWRGADRISYWVLFPALLFNKISGLDISSALMTSVAVPIYAGFFTSFGFALLAGMVWGFSAPLRTSLLQGASRHNTFIALALAELLFGAEGLAYATLVSAFLIPITNIALVAAMVIMLREHHERGGGLIVALFRDMGRNPLLMGLTAGFLVNGLGLYPLYVVTPVTDILGRAALPMMLLSVGANFVVSKPKALFLPLFVTIVGKMVIFPVVVVAIAVLMGVPGPILAVLAIFGCVPTAPSGYALARAMGGDAPAMANIVTFHTALGLITLPLSLLCIYAWFGLGP